MLLASCRAVLVYALVLTDSVVIMTSQLRVLFVITCGRRADVLLHVCVYLYDVVHWTSGGGVLLHAERAQRGSGSLLGHLWVSVLNSTRTHGSLVGFVHVSSHNNVFQLKYLLQEVGGRWCTVSGVVSPQRGAETREFGVPRGLRYIAFVAMNLNLGSYLKPFRGGRDDL